MFFGGKGGVGKTTCAAATAVALSTRGHHPLIISTDPAHSLGDALNVPLTSRPTVVRAGAGALIALEFDARRAFARWLSRHRHALGQVLEHGTWLDRDDIKSLLELTLPGIDELMAFVEIHHLASARDSVPRSATPRGRDARRTASAAAAVGRDVKRTPRATDVVDVVVVDTAPTGHTLRLLSAPDTAAALAGALDALQEEHRVLRRRFGRALGPDAADVLIDLIARQAREVGELLRDRTRTSFHLVTVPEGLSVAESADALAALDRAGIAVEEVVVNRVTPDGPQCPLCTPRRSAERLAIARIRRVLGNGRRLRFIPTQATEPRGIAALTHLIDRRSSSVTAQHESFSPERRRKHIERRTSPPESLAALRSARLLVFAGKGGVGKTTCAAAAALRLAAAEPDARVLLLSTDPAHSLGDVLKAPVGDDPVSIPGAPPNLRVRELDAFRALQARRATLEEAFGEIVPAGPGIASMLEQTPPGVDELLALASVSDSLGQPLLCTRIIVDAAPTGHALRLLELPDLARAWVQTLIRILLKYRELVKPGRLARDLVDVSRSLRMLDELLHDPRKTSCVVVTRPAALPRLETSTLLTRLRTLRLSTPVVIVNAVTPFSRRCPACRHAYSAEQPEIARLLRWAGRGRAGPVLIQTPIVAPPPCGVAALQTWADKWLPV